jgi:hypothetical protein
MLLGPSQEELPLLAIRASKTSPGSNPPPLNPLEPGISFGHPTLESAKMGVIVPCKEIPLRIVTFI